MNKLSMHELVRKMHRLAIAEQKSVGAARLVCRAGFSQFPDTFPERSRDRSAGERAWERSIFDAVTLNKWPNLMKLTCGAFKLFKFGGIINYVTPRSFRNSPRLNITIGTRFRTHKSLLSATKISP